MQSLDNLIFVYKLGLYVKVVYYKIRKNGCYFPRNSGTLAYGLGSC